MTGDNNYQQGQTDCEQIRLQERLCDEFESAWREGIRPDLTDFLERCAEPAREALFKDLLGLELDYRIELEESPGEDEYEDRFAQYRDAVQSVFATRCGRPTRVEETASTAANMSPHDAGTSTEPGDSIGRYRLKVEQGRGGFGVVWVAEDPRMGRQVAVKQLNPQMASDEKLRRRFLNEARVSARLEHPGVVPVHELGNVEHDAPFYTMKLVAGETLAEAIRRFHDLDRSARQRSVEELRLLNVFLAVAKTVQYAHAQGVIHRDLKPQNIVLGKFGETILLDWGLAKSREVDAADADAPPADSVILRAMDDDSELTRHGTVLGTPAYMSPEQAAGRTDDIDEQSDVYSLGVILYEMLTGQQPFTGPTDDVLQKVVSEEPPRPRSVERGIAPPLEAICLTAMAKERSTRYRGATGLTEDLERHLANEPVSVYEESWHERFQRRLRRHPGAVATLCAVLAVLLVAVTATFLVVGARSERDAIANRRLAEATDSALAAERLADERVKSNDFAGAATLLTNAVKRLEGHRSAGDLSSRLAARRDRVFRLAEFTRFSDAAWRFHYHQLDDEAIVACRKGLDHLAVLDGPPDGWWKTSWWKALERGELDADQFAQLREDTHALLLLYAGEIAKSGLANFPDREKRDIYRASLEACGRAQEYRPTQSGALLVIYCRLAERMIREQLTWLNVVRIHKLLSDELTALTVRSPASPVDFHFMGVGHHFLAHRGDNELTGVLRLFSGGNAGLHTAHPRRTSRHLLREATRIEPRRFWTYIWHGYTLEADGEWQAAEREFNTCVALRPGDGEGYAGRARAIAGQIAAADETKRESLRRRAVDDVRQAGLLAPRMASLRWECGKVYEKLQMPEQSLEQFAHYIELARPLRYFEGHSSQDEFRERFIHIEKFSQSLLEDKNVASAARAVLAMSQAALGEYPAAFAAADAMLVEKPEPAQRARLLTVRGLSALALAGRDESSRQRVSRALTDLNAALQAEPVIFAAAVGRAEARFFLGEHELALQELAKLLTSFTPLADWQRFEIHRLRQQGYLAQGKPSEAKLALREAKDANPLAAEKLPRGPDSR